MSDIVPLPTQDTSHLDHNSDTDAMGAPIDTHSQHGSGGDSVLDGNDAIQQPKVEKIRRKPGPKPSGKSQLMKNDMNAKKEVIKEIEGFWGKNFIRKYIPQKHRILVKRPPGTGRNIPRFPENDPRKWKPSVLKALRSLCEKSSEKARLRSLISDVVKYRNKHTGNKKPEIVTTDIDVIEDVIDRGWSVSQSFNIRYKHLLMNQPTDKVVGSDEEFESDSMSLDEGEDLEGDRRTAGDEDNDDVEYNRQERRFYYPEQQSQAYEPSFRKNMQSIGQQALPAFNPNSFIHPGIPGNPFLQQPIHHISARYPQAQGFPHVPQGGSGRNVQSPFHQQDSRCSGRKPNGSSHHESINNARLQPSPARPASSPLRSRDSSIKVEPGMDTAMNRDSSLITNLPTTDISTGYGDDDEELLNARMAVANANARRAELHLQLLQRRRAKDM
ncbi:hypothetical protein CC78DRAFT_548251 [Lojkania enalia]|uniref:Uncharacterized protein n=1 Tax=Lojkania enalia TaxID=147567 RepID=A0A9P4JYV8_9PLEO|nr:hypothetical protein CC78DRAFT_548251 [Didymosphaeria enalia]